MPDQTPPDPTPSPTSLLQAPPLGIAPILVVSDAAAASAFYQRAFNAEELARIAAPGGKRFLHIRLRAFGSTFVIMDELAEMNGLGSLFRAPTSLRGTSVTLHLQVADGNAVWQQALNAGARSIIPLERQFWGELYGRLSDPFGHEWTIAQFLQHLSDAQVEGAANSVFQAK